MSDIWKRKKKEIDPNLIYQPSGNDSPIIKYFWKLRPDLKGKLLVPQADLLKDLRDFHYLHHAVSCGRGFGKTMLVSAAGLYYADEWSTQEGKQVNVLCISSQKALFDNMNIFFRNNPDLGKRLTVPPVHNWIPQDGAEFKDNHSRIIPAMATVHSVEGNRADVLIFDETQHIPEDVITKALGCLKDDVLGIVVFIGTPYTEKKGLNWFIELIKDPKHFLKTIPFHLTQHSSDVTGGWNAVDTWKAAWSKERFNAECMGKVTENKDKSYFGSGNVSKCVYDIEPDPEGGMNSTREAGIDCGYHNTTYILTERIGATKRKVLDIRWWKDKSIEDIAAEIGNLLNMQGPMITKIDSKTGSIADYRALIKRYTYKSIMKVDASQQVKMEDGHFITTKECMRGQLLRKLREGTNLIIPQRLVNSKPLIDQLLKYNIHHKEGDDLVDALMLSCYEPPKGSLGGNGRVSIMNHPIHMEKGQGWKITGRYGL